MEQWAKISTAMKAKSHTPFIDCAYQVSHLLIYQPPACFTDPLTIIDCAYKGFASGNADTDAGALRLVIENDGFCIKNEKFCTKKRGILHLK